MSIRFSQVLQTLRDRGENEEADLCELNIVFELAVTHGFTHEEILEMTMDEIEKWYSAPPRPAKYAGWEHFYWGKEVVG